MATLFLIATILNFLAALNSIAAGNKSGAMGFACAFMGWSVAYLERA